MIASRGIPGEACDSTDLLAEALRLNAAGQSSALATVVESSGSSPRKVGAKMLVREDGSAIGSIGGGRVELETIAAAREVLREAQPRLLAFKLTERYGHVCGGSMRIFLEPNIPPCRLVIAGGGHVGAALAVLGRFAGFRITVLDERPEFASRERFPEADEILCAPPAAALKTLGIKAHSAIVIATAGFEQDFAVARAALRSDAGFIGMIGSRRKREVLARTLAEEGFEPAAIERIRMPVGLEIHAETPQEIAVSVVAQLIAFRRCRSA